MKPKMAKAQPRKRYLNFSFSSDFFFLRISILNDFHFLLQAKPDPESAGEAGDSSALSLIDIGGNLPDLTLKNEKGEDIQIANLASEKGVILFLVPKADTRASKRKPIQEHDNADPVFFSFFYSWVHESGVWVSR